MYGTIDLCFFIADSSKSLFCILKMILISNIFLYDRKRVVRVNINFNRLNLIRQLLKDLYWIDDKCIYRANAFGHFLDESILALCKPHY